MEGTASAVHPDSMASIIGNKPDWWPDWEGKSVAIVASGPTAKNAGVDLLRGRMRVMAINESWQLCPWADILYGCDPNWWNLRHGVREFNGLKISRERDEKDLAWSALPADVRRIKVARYSDRLMLDEIGVIGAGGNSGFQCLNLAVQFGAKRILLIGYDMRVDRGEHWHPRHPMPLSNPHPNDNLIRWRRAIDGASGMLCSLGIRTINCSMESALTGYPKMTVEAAMNEWDGQSEALSAAG